ncbi:MAG: zinc ribbon domain-containing protein [Firmicutes bacterium]|nr:zinc ribbon domain-containing protein [Bacillota bacterium]
MFCENCGKEIPDRALFCPYCNEQVTTQCAPVKIKTEEVEVFVDEVDEELSHRMKWLPVYIVMIVAGTGLFIFSIIAALQRAILGEMLAYRYIHGFISAPAVLLTAAGIVLLILACSRKQATKAAQKKKKALEETCSDPHCNCK